ncbi:MAG: four-carbon acid sugar kinase family protein [Rhizobiales bacterium]|nr:four-carbon acid sugar kinase family protein [Hyphomicrobiales bacterium]
MSLLLGCIADDFTGATDLASMLTRAGMRTVQVIDVPKPADGVPQADAIVVALKSRTIPAAEAIAQSLAACRWLKAAGARQFFFKYCSTFDSTDKGNIGPVADALLAELSEDFSIVCPAYPENGRSIYMGHLFVGQQLLSDSPMRNHPLTPMTDSNLVRVMGRQTPARVGLVALPTIRAGAAAIDEAFKKMRGGGFRYAVCDAVDESNLMAIGHAAADLKLITGGSGVALGLPDNFRKAGLLAETEADRPLPPAGGGAVVLAGSCSEATRRQVEVMRRDHPAFRIDPAKLAKNFDAAVAEAIAWGRQQAGPFLIYSSDEPAHVADVQAKLGRERAGSLVEAAFAAIAPALVAGGIRRIVVAGGETSGAVVKALGVKQLAIGPVIEPGVPATVSLGEPGLALALKSGNFGGDAFFLTALARLR